MHLEKMKSNIGRGLTHENVWWTVIDVCSLKSYVPITRAIKKENRIKHFIPICIMTFKTNEKWTWNRKQKVRNPKYMLFSKMIPICHYTTKVRKYYYYNCNLKTQMRFAWTITGIMFSWQNACNKFASCQIWHSNRGFVFRAIIKGMTALLLCT